MLAAQGERGFDKHARESLPHLLRWDDFHLERFAQRGQRLVQFLAMIVVAQEQADCFEDLRQVGDALAGPHPLVQPAMIAKQ